MRFHTNASVALALARNRANAEGIPIWVYKCFVDDEVRYYLRTEDQGYINETFIFSITLPETPAS